MRESVRLTVRTPRRSGHRHRCVAYLADIARAEWLRRAQSGQWGQCKHWCTSEQTPAAGAYARGGRDLPRRNGCGAHEQL